MPNGDSEQAAVRPGTVRYDLRTHGVVTIEVALLESARVTCRSASNLSPTSFRQQLLDLAEFEVALFRSSGVGHL